MGRRIRRSANDIPSSHPSDNRTGNRKGLLIPSQSQIRKSANGHALSLPSSDGPDERAPTRQHEGRRPQGARARRASRRGELIEMPRIKRLETRVEESEAALASLIRVFIATHGLSWMEKHADKPDDHRIALVMEIGPVRTAVEAWKQRKPITDHEAQT